MKFIGLLLSLLTGCALHAQVDTTNTPAEPVGGLNRLALTYYDIEFTAEQRKLLENVDIELIFSVSADGVAQLQSVNGVSNHTLRDSLFAQDPDLPRFHPEIRNDVPVESLYFMRFQFPSYSRRNQKHPFVNPVFMMKVDKDQFSILEESGSGFDMTFQGIFTNHFGKADPYLGPGGGVQLGFEYVIGKGIYVGMGFDMYGNRATDQMTVRDTLPYLDSPFSVAVGFYAGKRLDDRFSLQFEAYYATIGVTRGDPDEDPEGTDFQGFSPGLFLNYILPINKNHERVSFSISSPVINRFSINFRGGFRGFIMNNAQASGVMFEIGAGIRFGSYFIKRYRMKDSFYLE